MRRRLLIAAAAVAFVAVSVVLGRWLSVENVERDAVQRVLDAQGRGDAPAILAQLRGCDARCAQTARADAARFRAPGEQVRIVAYDSATGYSLSSATGQTRVAWKVSGRLTTVQCLRVRRKGSVLAGFSVSLLSLSGPIGRTSAC